MTCFTLGGLFLNPKKFILIRLHLRSSADTLAFHPVHPLILQILIQTVFRTADFCDSLYNFSNASVPSSSMTSSDESGSDMGWESSG